jgi:hypothetical protein
MNWSDDYLIPGIEPFHQEEAGIIYLAKMEEAWCALAVKRLRLCMRRI